jgi:dATP pyrophosphohydrolase
MHGKRPESVLVVVSTVDLDVLLLRRRHPAGLWQSVTGSLEWGESAGAAARRELLEETGIAADDCALADCRRRNRYPIAPAWRHRYASRVSHNTEHVWRICLAERPVVSLNPAEHEAFEWLPRSAAIARAHFPTDRAAIAEFSGAGP